MATLIPQRITASATAGERKLHRVLGNLPEDCVVYYEPDVQGRHPDFVILSPELGILVIEDKNWSINTITGGNRNEITIKCRDLPPKTVKHPVRQVREYQHRIQEIAATTRYGQIFLHQSGVHQGNLRFPITHFVTFSNITRTQLGERNLTPIFDETRTVTRDELERWEEMSADELHEALRSKFDPFWSFSPLTSIEMKALRAIIHPEIDLENAFSTDDLLASPRTIYDQQDVVKVLDLRQEALAQSIREGHRIIFGVAGSGKTMILLARARLIAAKTPGAKVLLTCYNRELARWIEKRVSDLPNLSVLSFHQLAFRNGVSFRDYEDETAFGEALLSQITAGAPGMEKFDAVLVDEAQDFEPNWFSCLLALMNDPENGDLLIVADGAQGLYRRSKLSWKHLGIRAAGRSHSLRFHLDQNYRNSSEILSLAETFAMRTLDDDSEEEDHILSVRVNPDRCVRSTGASPILFRQDTWEGEVTLAADLVGKLLQGKWVNGQKMPPLQAGEIAILYPGASDPQKERLRNLPDEIHQKCGINAEWVNGKVRAGDDENTLRIQTIHSSKGLQYRAVIILWTGTMPRYRLGEERSESERADRRLLYVAMTRAESFLAMISSGSSSFVEEIADSLACVTFDNRGRARVRVWDKVG